MIVYRASDERTNSEWLEELESVADRLDLGTEARSLARDLFLSDVPAADRSKRTTLATSLYVGALVAGEERSQATIAEAAGISRLSIQQHWKSQLESLGLDAPDW